MGTVFDQARSVIQQADGKLVLVGSNFGVLRLNANGSLDTSFSGDGKFVPQFGGSSSAESVIQQADGKLVIAGASQQGFSIIRLNANGSLDSSFDANGMLTLSVGTSDDYGYSVIQQTDGRLVVAGYTLGPDGQDFGIARLNTDGSLDTSFSGDGKLGMPVGAGTDTGQSIIQQSDGKLVVAGFSVNGASTDFSLVRLNADGSLDTGFGGNGKLLVPVGSGADYGRSVIQQADGKLVVAGSSYGGVNEDFSLIRVNADGSLDTTFGDQGKLIVSVSPGFDIGNEVIQQSDGKLVVAGNCNGDFGIIRLNADGSFDTTFSDDGKLLLPLGNNDLALSIVQQADGKLVVAGSSSDTGNFDYGFSIARLNADGTLDTTFDGQAANTLGGAVSYTEGGAAVRLDSTVEIVDAQLSALNSGAGNYSGASLLLARQGGASAQDVLGISTVGASFTVSGGNLQRAGQTFATFTSSNGTLTLQFTGSGTPPTQLLVNDVLSHITYANSSSTPPASVTLGWSFSDGNSGSQGSGGALSVTGISTINITAINAAPTITGIPGTAQSVTVSSAAALADFTVADADGDSLTVTLTANNGTLGNLTDANSSTPGIQLTGTAASINAAIAGATFTAAASGAASIGISVSDGVAASPTSGTYSLLATSPATFLNTLGSSVAYSTNGSPVFVDTTVAIYDEELANAGRPDGSGLTGNYAGSILVVQRQGGANSEDVLAIGSPTNGTFLAGFEALFVMAQDAQGATLPQEFARVTNLNGALEVLFLNNAAAVSTNQLVNSVLSSVIYSNTSGAPPALVNLSWTFIGKTAVTGVSTVSISAANAPPVLSGVPRTSQGVTAGLGADLADFTVSDSDGSILTVTLMPINGTLGNLTDVNSSLPGIQLTGTAASINAAIAGATFNATAGGAASIGISVSDGVAASPTTGTYNLTALAPAPVLVLPSEEVENKVPAISVFGSSAVLGDGNGDGISDAAQAAVASVQFKLHTAVAPALNAGDAVFLTLVSGSKEGKANQSESKLTNIQQLDTPADIPGKMKTPLGLISFNADVAHAGDKESFSLYVDANLGVNGYWKKDAVGKWVNLASEPYGGQMVIEGGKLRLDFVIQDGGQFDADGQANGSIADPGAAGYMDLSITDHQPVTTHDAFWF